MILPPASSSPFSWEDVAPAWRWSLQVRTWHHRLQRKCCRKGVSQNIQHNRMLVPSKYPTEYHHCWQRNYVRYFFFWESFNFFVLPLPKTGQSGGCGCGAGTWLPLYCAALEHRIVPPAATCSVVAQSGGRYCCCTPVGANREELGSRQEKSGQERETASPLCWPPALLAPGGNASRPTLGCPPSVAQISTNGKSFRKPTRCKEETIQFIVTFFLWTRFNKPDVFEKCTLQKIAAKDPHFVKNGVKASMWRQRVGLGNCAIRDSSGSEVGLTWNKETGCCWRSLDPLLFYCSSARGAFSQILHQVWDLILSVLPGEDWL